MNSTIPVNVINGGQSSCIDGACKFAGEKAASLDFAWPLMLGITVLLISVPAFVYFMVKGLVRLKQQ